MNRQDTIKTLQQIAAEIAQEMGYTEMRVGENRQKGIWGEGFTRYPEETYVECTKEIRWFKPDAPKDLAFGDNIEFSFRFSKPQICIDHREIDGALANVEFSDWNNKLYQEYEKEKSSMEEQLGRELTKEEDATLEAKHPYRTGNFKPRYYQIFEGDDMQGMEFHNKILEKWNKAVCRETALTDKNSIIDKVCINYRKYNTELTSLFFDFPVKADKNLLLEAYAHIQKACNGDTVVRLINPVLTKNGDEKELEGKKMDSFFTKDENGIYEGNYKDFLESFNGRELETGICRLIDIEMDGNTTIKGSFLDFIW